ncbi:MAG TPA: glucose-6-phosphate isomerase, partial [Methanothermococcus okinawensis]|nr:glucose-6-phosphate isomerase [Methanothermococcus okinawensis]
MGDYFKYSNVMREKLGSEGLSLEDIEGMRDIADMAYRRTMEKYEKGELGFMEVIYEDIEQYSLDDRDFKYILVVGM